MKRFINPSLSPNVRFSDVIYTACLLFSPFSQKTGQAICDVEHKFQTLFKKKYCFTFASAREAEYVFLKAAGIGENSNDEVLVQAFTCSAVVHPVFWAGAKPVYVDIDKETLSMNLLDLRKKITKRTKAIILQHTFGIPGPVDEVMDLAKKYKILVLEDCAHVVGGEKHGKLLGTFGDAAIFSFGRDKAISSVFGGAVVTDDVNVAQKMKKLYDTAPFPERRWLFQQLLHPILTYKAIFWFQVFPVFGKLYLFFLRKSGLIKPPVIPGEKYFPKSQVVARKYPNVLAKLLLRQLSSLSEFNKTREELLTVYRQNWNHIPILLPVSDALYLRIPIFIENPKEILGFFKKRNIYLGNWYSHIIDPKTTILEKEQYSIGSCKTAEDICRKVVNLPIYPRMDKQDVVRIITVFKDFYRENHND